MSFSRKHFLFLVAVATCSFFGTSDASASIIVNESFTHPNGNLVGQSPEVGGDWAVHSSGGFPVQVSAGSATVQQGSSSREDINTTFSSGAIGTGDKIYAAFDLTIPEITGSVSSTYFAHFGFGTSTFGARIWVAAPTTSGYRLALSGDSSITDNDGEAYWGDDLAFGTVYRVVTSYDYDSGETQLWLNPSNEASTNVVSTDGFSQDEFAYFALRQAGGNTSQVIDNLCVATTFDEALSCVPEPGSVLLFLTMGLIFLATRAFGK